MRIAIRGTAMVLALEGLQINGISSKIHVNRGREFMPRDRSCGPISAAARWNFSRRGAADKSFIEALKSRFQAECVNAHWFLGLGAPSTKWRHGQILQRAPGWEIGGRPPVWLHNCLGETNKGRELSARRGAGKR
ncbi:hypothetical protein [Bradyrhizobium shewense]|uniref:hypothetical protein n=1 Tax=Bradyrhizobium shewense TaxID=1761772 RepID=UPI00101AECE0|nr:hypothetical protein [Bradyrhizobium shewense]